jgi:hypothetical protein
MVIWEYYFPNRREFYFPFPMRRNNQGAENPTRGHPWPLMREPVIASILFLLALENTVSERDINLTE